MKQLKIYQEYIHLRECDRQDDLSSISKFESTKPQAVTTDRRNVNNCTLPLMVEDCQPIDFVSIDEYIAPEVNEPTLFHLQ